MPLTTTTEIAGPVDVKFQVQLLRNAKALAPYFLGTTPAEISTHGGTFTAKWRTIANLSPVTTPLAELTGSVAFPTRTGVQPTVTDITATVAKFGNFIFLNEEVDLLNFNGQTAKLTELLGMNAGQSLNRLQRNIAEDNLAVILTGTASVATDLSGASGGSEDLSLSSIADATNAITRLDALKFLPQTTGDRNIGTSPIRTSYWGICHVDATETLRTLTGFQSIETYANQTQTAMGEVGAVGGVRWIETTEATIDASAGDTVTGSATQSGRTSGSNRVDIYNSIVFGKDCLGSLGFGTRHVKESYTIGDKLPAVMVISHPKGSAGAGDPLNEISTMGWKSWHTGLVLNSDWGRVIRHVVNRLVSAE